MKARLILLETPIIVFDEEIKESDWYIDTTVDTIFKNDKFFLNGVGYKKIIAGIPELPSIDFSLLSEADCKKIEWVDVEKLARERYPIAEFHPATRYLGDGFIEGFQKAQSLNEKKYSLEDIKKAWKAGMEFIGEDKGDYDKLIQSLQQNVWDVEVEVEDKIAIDGHTVIGREPKITNNQIKIIKVL